MPGVSQQVLLLGFLFNCTLSPVLVKLHPKRLLLAAFRRETYKQPPKNASIHSLPNALILRVVKSPIFTSRFGPQYGNEPAMRLRSITPKLLLFLASLAVTTSAHAQNYAWQADNTGQVTIYRDGEMVSRTLFEMLDGNFNWVVITGHGRQPDGSYLATGAIPGGQLNLRTVITPDSSGIRVRVEGTPTAPVGIGWAYLNNKLTAGQWMGSTGTIGSFTQPMQRPIFLNENRTTTDKIVVSNAGGNLTIQAPGPTAMWLQDNRKYWQDWYGALVNVVQGNWNANQTIVFEARLSFSQFSTFGQDGTVTIGGSQWVPLTHTKDVLAGSALDLADPNQQPAGNKGWVVATSDGHFAFDSAPQTPVRFYGINLLGTACNPTHAQADRIATQLQRMGYNGVRLLAAEDVYNAFTTNSTSLDLTKLERTHYLLSVLKAKGMYISFDLYAERSIKDNEVIPGPCSWEDMRALVLINPTARQNWLTFALNLMNSTNPYTGLKLKDDPSIAFLGMVNENTLAGMYNAGQIRAELRAMFDAKWQAAGNSGPFNPLTDVGARFAAGLEKDTYNWMKTQLRANGVKALLTSMNAPMYQSANLVPRNDFDYVDLHWYWAHPFTISMPFTQPSTSVLYNEENFGQPATMRIKNKPFILSEWNFSAPNRYRAEAGIIMGSLAAVQQWDAMYRFCWNYGGDDLDPQPLSWFSISDDPIGMATERAIARLFLRKDFVTPSTSLTKKFDPATTDASWIQTDFIRSVLSARVNVSFTDGDPNADLPPITNGMISTPDGQITTDVWTGRVTLNTPNTVGMIGRSGDVLTAGPLKCTVLGARATVWLSSCDGRPLGTSNRMLLTHLTDVQNSGATFTGQDRGTQTSFGTLPYLAQAGTVKVVLSLKSSSALKPKVYRLDSSGKRIATITVAQSLGTISFDATIQGPQGATFFYEITK